jgi:regulatory NSL complex subunit 3
MAPMLPVQLSINSVAAQKQSLQTIAEQTVSVTRTKIQELKAENPDRRLILIGMNSAAAVAMQVALVEQVSGVVCFGFSYNTVHGVRGQADDNFLELSTPTLFLVGQNAARSNDEEIEAFREKVLAPTSMVLVGSADDFLRVSKRKRRLEGVTQEMVDNMIVDEISDFATKCLQRPLPAKSKALVTSATPRREIDSSTGQMRKRKVSGEGIKNVPMKTQKLMRPTSTTGIPGASSSDDVLDMAIQSILPDHEEKIPAKPTTQKFIATTRVVPGSISNQRMKVVHPPSQQFSTLKQQPNQAKFITITKNQKSFTQLQSRPVSRTVSNSRPTTPTQFTMNNRPGTKKIPVTIQQHQQSFSPTKYTIVRSTGNATPNVSYISETANSDLTGANIFDMPIVFADSEGNIDEDASAMSDGSVISVASDSPPRVGKQVILKTSAAIPSSSSTPSFTVTKNKNILIQKPVAGKMFMINGTVIGKQVSANNIVLPKSQLSQQMKVPKFAPGIQKFTSQVKTTQVPGRKIEILNNTIIKPATTSTNLTKTQATSFVNLADGKAMNTARLSLPIATTSKNQIIIKTNALKPYTGAQILPSSLNTKQLGNLTVKRLNVVPNTSVAKVFKKI